MSQLISSYVETANRALSLALTAGLNKNTRPAVDVRVPLEDPSKPNGVKTLEFVTVSYVQPAGIQGQIWLNADREASMYKSFSVFTNGAWCGLASGSIVANPEVGLPVVNVANSGPSPTDDQALSTTLQNIRSVSVNLKATLVTGGPIVVEVRDQTDAIVGTFTLTQTGVEVKSGFLTNLKGQLKYVVTSGTGTFSLVSSIKA